MILKAFKYTRNGGTQWEWTVKGAPANDSALQLGVINLIIGQNATGKSNTLKALRDLADLVSGEKKIDSLLYKTFSYDVLFDNDGTLLRYVLTVQKGKVVDEKLIVGDEVRGVAYADTAHGGFALTIAGNSSTEVITLSYYCDRLHRIFTLKNWTTFDSGIKPMGTGGLYNPRFPL